MGEGLTTLALTFIAVGCAEAPRPANAGGDAPEIPVFELVEEWRIGDLESDPRASFGELVELAVTAAGGVVVHDIQRGAVLEFDRDGRFVRRMGRTGQGPGEYDGVLGLASLGEGEVAVYSADRRLLLFGPDGAVIHERRLDRPLAGDQRMIGMGDSAIVLQVVERAGTDTTPTTFEYVRVGRDLAPRDSLNLDEVAWIGEARPGQPGVEPKKHEVLSAAGFVATGVSSRPALRLTRWTGEDVVYEFPSTPVLLREDEREEWERSNELLRARSGVPERFPPAPAVKPVFTELVPSAGGTLWVVLPSPSMGRDPALAQEVAGFMPTPRWLSPMRAIEIGADGTVIRELRGPSGIDLEAARGDTLWGYTRGAFGEQYVVRFVLKRSRLRRTAAR